MTLSRSVFLLAAAAICFLVALLIALSVVTGSSEQAWVDGGLLSLALSFLP